MSLTLVLSEDELRDLLFRLLVSVNQRDRPRIEWVMSSDTLKLIRRAHEAVILHDIEETPETLFGKPIVVDESVGLRVRVRLL